MSSLLAIASFIVVLGGSVVSGQDCHATAFIGTAYRDRMDVDYSFKAEIGAFADGFAIPASGQLVRAGDGFGDMGCSADWKQPSSGGPWIALVRRGGCSVELKIANAIQQGATGLIIYNNRDSLALHNLRVTNEFQGALSVVFTYKWKGEELATLLDLGAKITVDLSVANPCLTVNNDHERNMQLVSITFVCFIVLTISLAWLIFYYVQRNRDLLARERKARGYSEADEKALKAIPTKTIKANDKLLKDENECCAICIDPYRQSEVVRTLVCSHEFHKDCIDPWLLENRTCPMCKKDILRHYGSVFLGSTESIIQVMSDETQRLAGPSSPAIQVVVVANVSRATTPDPDVQLLTERVQPANTDCCFATSSSLLTVGSALVNPSVATVDSTLTASAASLIAVDSCSSASAASDVTVDSRSTEYASSFLTVNSTPSASADSLLTVDSADEVLPSCSEFESCQELREVDSYADEMHPVCVDENDIPLTSPDEGIHRVDGERTSNIEKDEQLNDESTNETGITTSVSES